MDFSDAGCGLHEARPHHIVARYHRLVAERRRSLVDGIENQRAATLAAWIFNVVVTALAMTAGGIAAPARLADVMALAKEVGDVPAFANDYVTVRYGVFEYRPAEPRVAEARPIVLYVQVAPVPGIVNRHALEPSARVRPSWRPGVVPRAVRIELHKSPPAPPRLGEPGTELPHDAIEDGSWAGGRLIVATFRPYDYGVGAGRFPSVTTFLSDGVVEVWNRGLRQRMGVQAGDAFWFEAATRLTVVDDFPVAAAILQFVSK